MGKTGGDIGSNQYGPKGVPNRTPPSEADLAPLVLPQADGNTPMDEDLRPDLVDSLTSIRTRRELDLAEAANILSALDHYASNPPSVGDLLSVKGVIELHRRMFDQTWRWAGTFRTVQTNLGVSPILISESLVNAINDARWWIDNETRPTVEVGVAFHYALVRVHPFPNGNGRHARLAADLLLATLDPDAPAYTWGAGNPSIDPRLAYHGALRVADRTNDLADLIAVATPTERQAQPE